MWFAGKVTAKWARVLGIFLAVCLLPISAWSHSEHYDSGDSGDSGITVEPEHIQSNQSQSVTTFPLKIIGGNFALIDHHGQQVTNESYPGQHLLVFFGYINCKSMCSISLARIGQALTLLGDSVNQLTPLVITVDPERDTPEAMKAALYKFHPRLIGLTGEPDKLQTAYQNYKQKPTLIGKDSDYGDVISHSSYIYLIDKNGDFATLFPPILNPQSMAKIIRKYIDDAG